ncbi:MAG: cupin domain-containing protein [Candidatus Bathyarchaeia archaeon]
MKYLNYMDVKAEETQDGAFNVKVRWLITRGMGAKNFAMRLFEVEREGFTPLHSHPWEHEVFILQGKALVKGGDEEKFLKKGDAIFIPPNEKHQFRNIGKGRLVFLCLIPYIDK